MSKAIYFFCNDLSIDPVASHVLAACRARHQFGASNLPGKNQAALVYSNTTGDSFYLVETERVLTDALSTYLDEYGSALEKVDFAAVVNWHQGNSAPAQVFTVHTNGDVAAGVFPVADASLTTAALRSLEHHRRQFPELAAWRTLPEATHCSGMAQGMSPEALSRWPSPLLDIEIGSYTSDWQTPAAHHALADALVDVFRFVNKDGVPVLFLGGVHFEPSLQETIFGKDGNRATLAHVLPNQWIAAYEGQPGLTKLRSAAASIRRGIRAVAFHDGLKGPLKQTARTLASELGVPAINHRRLRAGQFFP